MKTTKFEPKFKLHPFMETFGRRLNGEGMTAKIYEEAGNVRIDSVLLMKSQPHTAPYDQRYGGNWRVVPDPTAKNGVVGVNIHYPNMTSPIKMSTHPNYDDWVRFNTLINDVADDMNITFNLKTGVATFRNGRTRGTW